jgi:hypothetical protein
MPSYLVHRGFGLWIMVPQCARMLIKKGRCYWLLEVVLNVLQFSKNLQIEIKEDLQDLNI